MAYPVSATYMQAIAGPHQVQLVADVIHGSTTMYRGLPVMGGSLTVSSRQRARRACTLTITPTLPLTDYRTRSALPDGIDPTHPLSWHGPQIVLRHGLVYPSGIEWVPIGVLRIDGASGSLMQDEPVQVSGVSREAWLIDDTSNAGVYTTTGGMATDLIRARIRSAASAADVLVGTNRDRLVPASSADDADAWATVERLARSIGATAYADPAGTFVVAPQPTKSTPAVVTIRPGLDGTLVSATGGGSRDDVASAVAVTYTGTNGTQSRVLERNTDATSPTRWGDPSTGAFGRRVVELTDSSITTEAAARTMARAELAKRTGVASSINLTSVPMPFLEAGDVIDVVTDPSRPVLSLRRHVVDSISWDLTPGGQFTVTTRDLGSVIQ